MHYLRLRCCSEVGLVRLLAASVRFHCFRTQRNSVLDTNLKEDLLFRLAFKVKQRKVWIEIELLGGPVWSMACNLTSTVDDVGVY